MKRTMSAFIATAAVLTTAACSSSGSDSDGPDETGDAQAVVAANKILDDARAPITWKAPGPAFDATAAAGKKVLYVANNLQLPWSAAQKEATEKAMDMAGVSLSVIDAQGSADQASKAVQTGIGQDVDAIVLVTYPPEQMAPALVKAKEAGIAIIESFAQGDPSAPDEAQKALGIVANVSYCGTCLGKALAAWSVAHTEGDAHITAYGVLNDPASTAMQKATEDTLEEICPSCTYNAHTFQNFGDEYNQLPTQVASDMASGKTNVFIPDYDTNALQVVPTIIQKGKANDVAVISFNGTPSVVNGLLGTAPMLADLAMPYAWPGWATADQTLRVLSGEEPLESEGLDFRLLDDTNLSSVDVKGTDEEIYGMDPATEYPALWNTAS